jgi:hypothetical protein
MVFCATVAQTTFGITTNAASLAASGVAAA